MKTIKFIVVVSMVLLTSDLVYHQVVNGYTDPSEYEHNPVLHDKIIKLNELELLAEYCREHSLESANPIQDLNKSLISPEYQNINCQTLEEMTRGLAMEVAKLTIMDAATR